MVAVGAGCEPEQETEQVRALLKGRDLSEVLPTGYGPRKKRFCHCQRRFQKALRRFGGEFQGGVKDLVSGMKTRLLRTKNQQKKP